MTDAPTIQERIARATRSSHLEHKDRPCDVDKIGALGMAALGNEMSSMVFRLKYANEARFYRAALAVVVAESMRLGSKRAWVGTIAQFEKLGKACLDYWINDRCIACEGRGYEKILGTPVLSDTPCGACNGSAKAPAPTMQDKGWQERFETLLAVIEDMERRAGGDVLARLASNVADFK